MSRSRRAPLDRATVVAAAVAVADDGGVAAVTMRRVAERLGVEAMSLYHHVEHKAALLDGLVDAVFAEIELPAPTQDWRRAMRERAAAAREVLGRHPWALGLLDSRRDPGPATLRHHDTVLGCLVAGGFAMRDAVLAFAIIDSFVHGFVLQEQSLPFDTAEELEVVAEGIEASFDAAAHPHLAASMAVALAPGYDFGAQFDTGLELVLDGIERLATGAP